MLPVSTATTTATPTAWTRTLCSDLHQPRCYDRPGLLSVGCVSGFIAHGPQRDTVRYPQDLFSWCSSKFWKWTSTNFRKAFVCFRTLEGSWVNAEKEMSLIFFSQEPPNLGPQMEILNRIGIVQEKTVVDRPGGTCMSGNNLVGNHHFWGNSNLSAALGVDFIDHQRCECLVFAVFHFFQRKCH